MNRPVRERFSKEVTSRDRKCNCRKGRRVGNLINVSCSSLIYEEFENRPTRSYELDYDNGLPFSRKIREELVLDKFVRPIMENYSGKGDPMYHLYVYMIHI